MVALILLSHHFTTLHQVIIWQGDNLINYFDINNKSQRLNNSYAYTSFEPWSSSNDISVKSITETLASIGSFLVCGLGGSAFVTSSVLLASEVVLPFLPSWSASFSFCSVFSYKALSKWSDSSSSVRIWQVINLQAWNVVNGLF